MTAMKFAGALAAVSLLACAGAAAAQGAGQSLVDKVRQANARFQDISQATKEGYAAIPCTSGIDGGAMGVHMVNPNLIGKPITEDSVGHPQAVMYEPGPDGKMRLIAVEYISTTPDHPTSLGGQLFSFNGAPNRYGLPLFYSLHVWAWKPNPKGPFADFNPTVTCEHAH